MPHVTSTAELFRVTTTFSILLVSVAFHTHPIGSLHHGHILYKLMLCVCLRCHLVWLVKTWLEGLAADAGTTLFIAYHTHARSRLLNALSTIRYCWESSLPGLLPPRADGILLSSSCPSSHSRRNAARPCMISHYGSRSALPGYFTCYPLFIHIIN